MIIRGYRRPWPEFWIEHPAADGCSVGFVRWMKWRLSDWLGDMARRLERQAFYPNCDGCGKPRHRGNHSQCDEIPF